MQINWLHTVVHETEIINIHSRFRETTPLQPFKIGDTLVHPVSCARNLVVYVDSTLTLQNHVKNICKAVWFSIHKIGRLMRSLNNETPERLTHAFVTARLDWCNSLLIGLPGTELQKLQCLQNTVARLVSRTKDSYIVVCFLIFTGCWSTLHIEFKTMAGHHLTWFPFTNLLVFYVLPLLIWLINLVFNNWRTMVSAVLNTLCLSYGTLFLSM